MSALALPHDAVRPGQGTLVEQSRAQAEVMAAMMAAKQAPRDEQRAQDRMEQVCRMTALAERAFFRFPRGKETVSGASVHLARELARCWGNVHYEVKELSRDDLRGESEMQALAWDLETNTRDASIFIVPHKRDTRRDGPKPITDMRDIYENNANAGARRLRECIFAVLPLWYVEAAKDLCNATLKDGGGVPLPQRIAKALDMFEAIHVTRAQLERKIGRGTADWNEHDVASLQPIYSSIQRGEISRDVEFPPEADPVTLAELGGAKAADQ
jgi:hypothetical protein